MRSTTTSGRRTAGQTVVERSCQVMARRSEPALTRCKSGSAIAHAGYAPTEDIPGCRSQAIRQRGDCPRDCASWSARKMSAGRRWPVCRQNFGLWPLLGKSVAVVCRCRLGGTDRFAGRRRAMLTHQRRRCNHGRSEVPRAGHGQAADAIDDFSNELPRLAIPAAACRPDDLLRLTQSFYGREDHDLGAKLQAELSGILLWAVAGWQRLRERGRLEQPESGREMLDGMADLSSPVGAFIRDRCLVGPGYRAGR